jgi:D-alanyl-lipoteichoic acid acyltransferase DltB (MBOAT superfamily)
MLFNSAQFIFVFLPIVLSVFFLLGKLREQMLALMWLAAASLFFYSWDDPYRLLPLIVFSIVFNFMIGRMLLASQSRVVLAIGICGDLLLLGYFKYAGFAVESFSDVTGIVVQKPNIALPIGISFFTFTQIAFLVDAYRGEAREYEPIHYTLFVSFFPHLIAGPIYHHKEIMPQFQMQENFRFHVSNLGLGLTWFALGLAKKVLFADVLAQYATPIFDAAAAGKPVGLVEGWIGVSGFALQLYYDFSGYTDMAIGLALMIGIRFPLNFNSPYKAQSLVDFWRRWHMTLSRFLRDYLYIPLGGNRKGPRRRYVNLLITMLLGGLWHGAAWTFVIWGAIHGCGLVVNHAWNKIADAYRLQLPNAIAWALTLVFVMLAWVPFRADNLSATFTMWKSVLGVQGLAPGETMTATQLATGAICIVGLLVVALFAPNTQQLLSDPRVIVPGLRQPSRFIPSLRWAVAAGVVFGIAVSFIITQRPTEFLYFRF